MDAATILALFFSVFTVCASAKAPTCDERKTDPKYLKVTEFEDSCFFIIKGATSQSSKPVNASHALLDITVAREKCVAEAATLATINSKEERVFLHENYHKQFDEFPFMTMIVLGLTLTNGSEYIWDDGKKLKYHDPKWINEDKPALFTVAILNVDNMWWSLNGDEALQKIKVPIGVLCKHSATAVSPSPASEITTVGPPSICDLDDDPAFTKVLTYKLQSCYFLVADAHLETFANFSLPLARTVCGRHNATLPSIHSKDESDFLIENFWNSTFGIGLNLLLGLKQVQAANKPISYQWDDSSNMTYQHSDWTRVNKDWQYTVATRDKKWLDIGTPNDTAEFRISILTVCKQPHFPSPTTTPSPVTGPYKGSNCDDAHRGKFKKTVVQGNLCYYLAHNATLLANQKSRITGKLEFNIATARSICWAHGGSLPIVQSSDEAASIVEHVFGYEDHVVPNLDRSLGASPLTEAIALGLHQVTSGNELIYKWDDISDLS